jgi:hypothetical protein
MFWSLETDMEVSVLVRPQALLTVIAYSSSTPA